MFYILNLRQKNFKSFIEPQSTHRFDLKQEPIYYTVYKDKNGSLGRVFGIDKAAQSQLPAGAKLEYKVKVINWVHAYVAHSDTLQNYIKTTNSGLEIVVNAHPNDIFVNTPVLVTALFEGKPLQGGEIRITRGNTRYRKTQLIETANTDENGEAEIAWQEAGMYVLELAIEERVEGKAYDKLKHASYLALEVLPE